MLQYSIVSLFKYPVPSHILQTLQVKPYLHPPKKVLPQFYPQHIRVTWKRQGKLGNNEKAVLA